MRKLKVDDVKVVDENNSKFCLSMMVSRKVTVEMVLQKTFKACF